MAEDVTPKAPRSRAVKVLGTGDSVAASVENAIENLFSEYEVKRTGKLGELEEAIKDAQKFIKENATGKKEKSIATNIIKGIEHHLDEWHEHPPADAKAAKKRMTALSELKEALKEAIADHKENPDDMMKAVNKALKQKGVAVPGQLIRSADIKMVEEYKAQFSEHMGAKGVVGKGVAFAGSVVGLGVISHGLVNIKRGMFGYSDPETGEKRGGALSNIVVGAGEVFVGLSGLKRALTGRWGFGRATHVEKHHHHDDHGHGGHGHGGH